MISILMATYNGGKYIEEQIESILNQSYQNYQLLIHDDGSVDNTIEIVKRFVNSHGNKIKLIDDGFNTGGPRNNFFHLMKKASSPYIMFCDQDDIWLPDKIKNAYNACKKLENNNSSNTPVLVFSDLIVTDQNLKVISESLFEMQKTNPEYAKDINKLFYRNCVTGCTMLFNKSALDAAMPLSKDALMHDWWLALKVLSNNGKVGLIDSKDILYRQHGENSVGAKIFSWSGLFKRNIIINIRNKYKQALAVGHRGGYISFVILSVLSTMRAGVS